MLKVFPFTFSLLHDMYIHICDWFEKNNTLLNGYILAGLFKKIYPTTFQSYLVQPGGTSEAI